MGNVNFRLMAQYNRWINGQLFDCASRLSPEQLAADRGAFFKSILGTLNHILVADIIWLRRFAGHPDRFAALQWLLDLDQPASLDAILHEDLDSLRQARDKIDQTILDFCDGLGDAQLDSRLDFHNTRGEAFRSRLDFLLQHLFNHQTHHRGQLTTLFNQLGIDVGMTDLLYTIRYDPAFTNL